MSISHQRQGKGDTDLSVLIDKLDIEDEIVNIDTMGPQVVVKKIIDKIRTLF